MATDPDGSSIDSTADAGPDQTLDETPDTSSAPDVAAPPPAPVPAGKVATRGLVTVIENGKSAGPEVCLGPIQESYPPMCSGPAVVGWDWDRTGQGIHETQGAIRWGLFALTGTFDGTSVIVESAIPAALYDVPQLEDPPLPPVGTTYDEATLQSVASNMMDLLPGVLNAYSVSGVVLCDVVYDDGSLQQWADDLYGLGNVIVNSALTDVG